MRISDWSSDVCSSDLSGAGQGLPHDAGDLHLPAVDLPSRPGNLLDLEQHPVDDPTGLHHEAPRRADRRRCGEDLHLRERCLWAKPHPGKKKPPSKQGGFSLPAPATSWSRQPTRTTSRSSAARSEEHTSETQSLRPIT